MKISVGVSNRHVHLTEEHFKTLFGEDATLEVVKELTQPGQFASNCKVTIKTEKSEIPGVRVLGPIRPYTQVEISKTDAFKLGLNPPVRNSGDLENSSPITIVGPNGSVDVENGCIIATRHIHATPADAENYGLTDGQVVKVEVINEKGGILYNVSVKVSEANAWELHVDTDDANGNFIKQGDIVNIIVD